MVSFNKLIYFLFNSVFIHCLNCNETNLDSCGKIARPYGLKVLFNEQNTSVSTAHKHQTKVYYECENKLNLLIGNNVRQCDHGYWKGSIPRCAINYINKSHIISVECSANESTLPSSKFNVTDVFNMYGAFTPPGIPPKNCMGWNFSGDDSFLFDLSESIQIHFIRIKLYANNLKKILTKNELRFSLSLNQYSEHCQILNMQHLNEENKVHDNYLTIDFDCGLKIWNRIFNRIKLNIKHIKKHFFQILMLFVCDIRIYHFDGSCGEPDIPLTMNVRQIKPTLHEYECKDRDHYFLNGVGAIQCDSFGKWKDEFPTCISKSFCEKLLDITYDPAVDILYESFIVGQGGDIYIPHGNFANFSCNHIKSGYYLRNETNYILKGLQRIQCLDGQWEGLTEENSPNCVVGTLVFEAAPSISMSRYVILTLSVVLFFSLIIVLSLCVHTIRSQKKRRQKLTKKTPNFYDNYDVNSIYDDIAVDENDEGVYEKINDDLDHVYECANEDYKNEDHNYIDIRSSEYIETKLD